MGVNSSHLTSATRLVLCVGILCVFLLYTLYDLPNQSNSLNSTNSVQDRTERSFKKIQIYVYPWPEDLVNCWPRKFQHHRLSFGSQFKENRFEGQILSENQSFFHTHQYSLYQLFYHRLIVSPYYTKDPEKATHFLIPYDIGAVLFVILPNTL